jgi:hypothetical protein
VTVACAVNSVRLAGDPDRSDHHIDACLRCQVEAVRYRTLVRTLESLRTDIVPAPPGFVGVVRSGLSTDGPMPKKGPGIETAMAAAGLAAVAVALWRRRLSA